MTMTFRFTGLIATAALALAALAGDASAQMLDKKALSIAEVKKIAAAAMDEANKNNWNVVVSVIDDGGNLMYLERKDGTQLASSDIAVGKARAALYFKRPSKALEDTINGGPNPARTSVMTLNQNVVMVDGGLLLMYQGQIVGAIGVSGVTSAQDAQVAKAGVDALK
jgi:glc operon protein GlcG